MNKITQLDLDAFIKKFSNYNFITNRNLVISFEPDLKTGTDQDIKVRVSYHTLNLIERLIAEKLLLSQFYKESRFRDINDRDQYGELLRQIHLSFDPEDEHTKSEIENFNELIQSAKFGVEQ